MSRPTSMFRGSERPRLLLLAAIVAVGWPLAWYYHTRPAPGPARPGAALGEIPPPPPPDRSEAFVGLQDKTAMTFRDSAAYAALLALARETPAAEMEAGSYRHDLPYTQLWERPERYRGVLIHIEGTARRVLVQDDLDPALAPKGKVYEAYAFTPESQNNPYILVFEDAPSGFPSGSDISERIAFDGYFLKLLAYKAGDTLRAAPMLVGRLHWRPYREGQADDPTRGTVNLTMLMLAAFTLYALIRWGFHLRRLITRSPRRPAARATPSEAIEPEALSDWLERIEDDPDETRTR